MISPDFPPKIMASDTFRACSLYFTVDDSSDLLEIGPTRKKNATWRWSEPTCFWMEFIRHYCGIATREYLWIPKTVYSTFYLPYDFLSSDFLSSLNFGQVTDIQMCIPLSICLMTFCLVTFCLVWILVKWQTYRHTDIQNTVHMSPPCIRTGGLKKGVE